MTEQEFRFDLHCHTVYSCDSTLSPHRLIESARRAGLGAVAVTDHNTMQGVRALIPHPENLPVVVIAGEEISTEYGDLMGIFLHSEIRTRIFAEVLDEIHDQDGISILPHPCRRKAFPPMDLLNRIQFIESPNARTSGEKNEAAYRLAQQLGKPVCAGSDSHFPWEPGTVWNAVLREDVTGPDDVRSILLSKAFTVRGEPVGPIIRRSNLLLSHLLKKAGRSRCPQ